MAKEKFERKHLTKEEIDRVLHRGQEPTEAEEEKAERAKAWIAEKHRIAIEKVLSRGGKVTDGKDYKKIDGTPEPRENESTKTTDDDGRG